ncbi:hypothetical protein XENOCAPTIV_004819 [Xenoophorus captivus]|uniref:Transferrin receptor-like dimerisation domain-containing protein n=1 Tax=Xenoophorus captivus TaxID=1517983 RepID=A0ABV0RNW6_9TELE
MLQHKSAKTFLYDISDFILRFLYIYIQHRFQEMQELLMFHFTVTLHIPKHRFARFVSMSHRHVIWASSSSGKATFPGIADAFAQAESSGSSTDWNKVHYHLSVVTQAIEGAADMLNEVI